MESAVSVALDSVLRKAVAREDYPIVEAYREIYLRLPSRTTRTSNQDKVHAALRLGILLALEIRYETLAALPDQHRAKAAGPDILL